MPSSRKAATWRSCWHAWSGCWAESLPEQRRRASGDALELPCHAEARVHLHERAGRVDHGLEGAPGLFGVRQHALVRHVDVLLLHVAHPQGTVEREECLLDRRIVDERLPLLGPIALEEVALIQR